jgi:hypothetical protein
VTHHLEALPPWPSDLPPDPFRPEEEDALRAELEGTDDPSRVPLLRPVWWRWVAIAVVVAMVVAGPIAFVLSRLLS